MSERVKLTLTHVGDDPARGDIHCLIETNDADLSGLNAVFSVVAVVEVKDSRPVNDNAVLYTQDVRLSPRPIEIRIPREEVRAYSYSGQMIEVKLRTRLVIDDSILFDTKVTEEHELLLGLKPQISTDAKSIIEPGDAFDFFKNLKAIPFQAQVLTMTLVAVGAVIVLVNTLIGLHDQFTPENLVWLYSHYDADGDSSPPLVKSLAGSGGLGLLVWVLMRKQLRRYMAFSLRRLPVRLRRGRTYAVNDLVRGRSRVPLIDATLRVVACNMELGQYIRGSGTDQRTVSFREPTRGVVLYEKKVDHIPAHVPVAPHFDGVIDFEPMFAALYPPIEVSSTHGVAVHWEVQLLHPEFVDQELVGPSERFSYEDFLPA